MLAGQNVCHSIAYKWSALTPVLDIDDLALVDKLSGGKVDLTYGRCVLLVLKLMGMFVY